MIKIDGVATCKRCGSKNTSMEILVPSFKRGTEKKYSCEISCKNCGKIERTEIKIGMK